MRLYLLLTKALRACWREPSIRATMIVTVSLILSATLVYMWIEGWDFIDSLYFSVMTISTVGYGDIAPKTNIGKLFTIAYVIIGLGLFVTMASQIANQIIKEMNKYDAPGLFRNKTGQNEHASEKDKGPDS